MCCSGSALARRCSVTHSIEESCQALHSSAEQHLFRRCCTPTTTCMCRACNPDHPANLHKTASHLPVVALSHASATNTGQSGDSLAFWQPGDGVSTSAASGNADQGRETSSIGTTPAAQEISGSSKRCVSFKAWGLAVTRQGRREPSMHGSQMHRPHSAPPSHRAGGCIHANGGSRCPWLARLVHLLPGLLRL